MHADDIYRTKLQATVAALKYWLPEINDTARVSEISDVDYWKIAVEPKVPGACPFELMLRTDQRHDLIIAGEVFEDQPTTTLDLFVPLVDSIAEGRVVQRRTVSAATGAPVALRTIITLPDGHVWEAERTLPDGLAPGALDDLIIEDRHFLPYRR